MLKKGLSWIIIIMIAAAMLACNNGDKDDIGDKNSGKLTDISLASDGESEYKIVIPAAASETEKYAADELRLFFGQSTGVELEIINDEGISNYKGKYLSIGDTTIYSKSGMSLSSVELGTDGYKILTKGNAVIMNAAGENGKMYAVYEFLTRNLGVKFYSYDEIKVPKVSNLMLINFDITDIPDFKGRDPHYYRFFYDTNSRLATRMRTTSRRTVFYENNGEGSPWSSLWAHEQLKILPYEKYKENEDWFMISDKNTGVRRPVSLCWTNSQMQQEFIKNLKQYIINEPDKIFFSIAQEDGMVPCDCADCLESYKKYTVTGAMIRFSNIVARAIKDEFPDREIYLVAFAYQDTLMPPVKRDSNGKIIFDSKGKAEPIDPSVVAEDNLIIRYAPLYNSYAYDLMDAEINKETESLMEWSSNSRDTIMGWASVAKNLTAWSYCTGFGSYAVNFNNFSTIQSNYRMFKEYGFIDLLDQGPSDTTGTAFESLRVYVQSQLMWDVDRDYNALVDDFMDNYYYVAASEMKEYYNLIRNHYAYLEATAKDRIALYAIPSSRYSSRIIDKQYFSREVLEKFEQILDNALDKAEQVTDLGLRAKLINRINAETIQYRYLQLDLYGSYFKQVSVDTLTDMIDEFERIASTAGLTMYAENKPLTEKIAQWRELL